MTRALIVEDDAPAMRLMAWALEDAGMDVLLARDPEGATSLLVDEGLEPEVIVLNSQVSVARKSAWVSELRRLSHGARIIDLAKDATSPGHDTGADAYVTSPYRATMLVAQINQVLQRT